MSHLRARYGPWALVTGASSGIGADFARQLAAHGLNLVLVARRAERLQGLAGTLHQEQGVSCRAVPLDLSHESFLPELQAATADLEIGLLVNSAGFSLTGNFLDHGLDDELQMLHVNGRASMLLAHAYGSEMRKRGHGGIIFLSSIAGFMAVPYWSHYAATKAYDLFLAEGLAAELRQHDIDVLALAPGTTRTEFLAVAEIDEFMCLDVDFVVRQALASLGRKRVVTPGWFYRSAAFATRFLPRSFSSFVFSQMLRRVHRS